MKRWIVVFSLLLVGAILAAWVLWFRPGPKNILLETVTIPLEGDIQTLDPAKLSDPVSSRVVWQIYEGLVGLNAKNDVVPLLSNSWQSQDGGRRWVFTLRSGVEFHPHQSFGQGQTRTVNASDVVYSYERMARGFGSFVFQGLIEGFEAYIKGQATSISGLKATSPNEVTFTLTRPDPSFIYRITSPYLSIMPREVVEANPNTFGQSVASGTGPFRLVSANATEVVLEQTPRYWQALTGNIKRLIFRVEKNPQFRVSGFLAGKYDMLQLPAEFRLQFLKNNELLTEYSEKYRIFTGQTFNVHYLGMDVKKVKDESLRRAIYWAINREAITSRLLSSGAILARGPIPPGMQGYSSPSNTAFDPEMAKRELAKSSYKNEELTILVSSTPNHADVAQVIQSDLLKCGIRTRIDLVDFNAFVTSLFKPDRPPLFLSYSEWIYSAPEVLMEQFKSSATPNPNVFGFSNERVDALLDRLSRMLPRADINNLCNQIERIVVEAPPAAWLYHETHTYIAQHRLSGFAVTGNNHWLLADLRSEQ